MPEINPKINIKSATTKVGRKTLGGRTVATMDFFRLLPTFAMEVQPHDDLHINLSAFTRCEALVKPVFAETRQENRFFFIPYRVVFPHWNDFINGTRSAVNGGTTIYTPFVPTLSFRSMCKEFIDGGFGSNSFTTSSGASETSHDIFKQSSNGTYQYYRLTTVGRHVFSVLRGIGYNICGYSEQTSSKQYQRFNNYSPSVLPLLAYCKVIIDYYFPTSFDDSTRNRFSGLIDSTLGMSRQFTASDFLFCLQIVGLYTYYKQDYFTAGMQNPMGNPLGAGASASFSVPVDNVGDYQESVRTDQNAVVEDISSDDTISQYGLSVLKGLSDAIMRFVKAGFRPADRYKARFGIDLPDANLNMSSYLGKSIQELMISDVMCNADSQGASIGEYAGKGVFTQRDKDNIHFRTEEYGFLVCISQILPKIGYVQGQPRYVLHTQRYDFFSPEFDMAGNQMTAYSELFNDFQTKQRAELDTSKATDGFNFMPRYAETKVGRDMLLGDAIVPTRAANFSSYHLFRVFDWSYAASPTIPTEFNLSFLSTSDRESYDRIFYVTDGSIDNFTSILYFDVTGYRDGCSLFENYDFDGARDVQILEQSAHM